MPFKACSFDNISKSRLRKKLRQRKSQEQEAVAGGEKEILASIKSYEDFFEARGVVCPLTKQFRDIRESGIPSIGPFVQLLLTCEMTTGVLMGIHDYSSIKGSLTVDAAVQGESFQGVREQIQCKQGEIIIRDREGIIASYFQGPDKRTAITSAIKDVIVLCLGAPGMSEDLLDRALEKAGSYLASE